MGAAKTKKEGCRGESKLHISIFSKSLNGLINAIGNHTSAYKIPGISA